MSNPHSWLALLATCLPLLGQTLDFGDHPDSFDTLAASDGPRHLPDSNLYLGATIADAELDAAPSADADGDGTDEAITDYAVTPGLEDLGNPNNLVTRIQFPVKNTTGGNAELTVFADFFLTGQLVPIQSRTIQNNTNQVTLIYTLPKSAYPASGDLEVPFRFRLSTTTGLPSTGPMTAPFPDGEIEDHLFNFGPRDSGPGPTTTLDFGDFPDSAADTSSGDFSGGTLPDYRTLAGDNGPSHTVITGLSLGQNQLVDTEADGQPHPSANGDTPDEDALAGFGISFNIARIGPGSYRFTGILAVNVVTNNTTGSDAYLQGWADTNFDGDFTTAELASGSGIVTAGNFQVKQLIIPVTFDTTGLCELVNYPLIVPLRLRLSSDAALTPYGTTGDGEVEDHLINFPLNFANFCPDHGDLPDLNPGTSPGDFSGGTLPDYRTRFEDNGPNHRIIDGLSFNDTSEPDGDLGDSSSQNPTATADLDDESGLLTAITSFTVTPISSSPLVTRAEVSVLASLPIENTTGSDAFVRAWVDSDLNGDFTFFEELNLSGDTNPRLTIPGDGSQTELQFTIPYTFLVNDACQIDGDYYLPLRVRLSSNGNIGPYFGAPDGEVEDHLIRIHLVSSDFCATDDRDFLRTVSGNALVGASLNLAPGDFLPATYSDQASPVWFLGRENLGTNPTLTPAQITAINNGSATLFFQSPGGASGIAPAIELIESTDLLTLLSDQELSGTDLAPYLDPDGDGWPSLAEYALASDANDPSSQPLVSAQLQPDPTTTDGHLGLLYQKRLGTPPVTYETQGSSTLGSWDTPVEAAAIPTGLPAPTAGYQWAFDRFPQPESNFESSFLRLKIE